MNALGWLPLFVTLNYALAGELRTSYKLIDGNEIPAVALGTSLGHLSDYNNGLRMLWLPRYCSASGMFVDAHVDGFHAIMRKRVSSLVGRVRRSSNSLLAAAVAHLRSSFMGHWAMMLKPVSSLGTRLLSVNHSVARAVQWALDAGYRHVDTASLYRTEDDVGLGVRNYLAGTNTARSDVFVTTKLWIQNYERDEVPKALRNSLKELQLEYVDLFLMHYPFAFNKDGSVSNTDYITTWKGIEDVKDLNLTRSIGVSNFNLTQMKRLWDNSRIKPAVLQIEVNPTITQYELVDWCREKGIIVMAYSPFGAILGRKSDAPPPKTDDPFLQSLASKYKKTVPQILLRYLLDRGMVPIARSMNKERIEQNIAVFDFALTHEEVQQLSQFDKDYRLRTNTYVKFYRHPHFPFPKKNATDAEIQHAIDSIVED